MKRTCKKCGEPIRKNHRWHFEHHKFLWFRWSTVSHRDCARPTEIHKHVIRLKGEVPLPFMDVTELSNSEIDYMIRKDVN